MKVSISKITSTINKISDMTSGDKVIPGVLLDLSENLLKVCYSDGHKSLIEKLEVETEETDRLGGIIVDFNQLHRAIANCQPSGIIKVEEIEITFKDNNIITISADQLFDEADQDGNIVNSKKLATKQMDLNWTEPGSDMKSAILIRMKYEDIFDADITDEFNKSELMDALAKTSTEKGNQIYLSVKTQSIFVANRSHVTSVPVSKLKELTDEELNIIYADLADKGEEEIKKEIERQENRMHFSVVMSQSIAKALIGILNKTNADKVYLHTKDKYCNIYVESDEETVGVWFEMGQASKAHIGALERYNALKYETYQTLFLKDFLVNNIKSALNVSKSEKTKLKFSEIDGETALIISAGSSASSISDVYSVKTYSLIDPSGDITSKEFSISLKVLSDMVDQLKTQMVAMDIESSVDGLNCIRLSEVNFDKYSQAYADVREQTRKLCESQGLEFNASTTPTPAELKLGCIKDAMLTKQYTTLSK